VQEVQADNHRREQKRRLELAGFHSARIGTASERIEAARRQVESSTIFAAIDEFWFAENPPGEERREEAHQIFGCP
jgi:hypothetical protein